MKNLQFTQYIKKDFNIKIKNTTIGLNPHAGENGEIGIEEKIYKTNNF